MHYINKQIHFTAALKGKVSAGFILRTFLSMLILFLEPFDTNQFKSNYRTLLLLGFGGILYAVFLVQSLLENKWYKRVHKVWTVKHEIISTLFFFILSGTCIFLYNQLIINESVYSLKMHWWYYSHIVLAMIPIVAPILIYVRQKFGERILPIPPDTLIISGENKNEQVELKRNELLYIQAVENYIELFFIDSDQKLSSKIFRQTLSKVQDQVPFLEKCHRSYLVNMEKIQAIEGNSQRARIAFLESETKIPLSKTCYKKVKSLAH